MNCTISRSSSQIVVNVDGELTIAQVREFRDALLPVVGEALPVLFDFTGVNRIDASILQVLYAMKKTAGRLSLQGISAAMGDYLARAGVSVDGLTEQLPVASATVNGASNG